MALVDFDSVTALTGDQWKEIEHYISAAGFWNSPVADPYDEGSKDGSNWVIEGRKNGTYHFINRRNADGNLMPFGKYLIGLSGLKIEKDAIY